LKPCISESRKGVIIHVKVKPNSRKQGIIGVENGFIIINLESPPIRGKANKELLKLLKKKLKARVTLISGSKSRERKCYWLRASVQMKSKKGFRFK